MPKQRLTLAAPAKINLAIKVIGKQKDGWHLLNAPTVPIDLADKVTVELRNDKKCVNQWQNKKIQRNAELGLKAAKLLQQYAGVNKGVNIFIDKKIPIGAGLGGGSSDAAAVLIACNRLWKLGWSLHKLANLAIKVGSDVPFFVYCRQAQISNFGDQLIPLANKETGWCLLVVPKERCSTKEVFAKYDSLDLTKQSKSFKINDDNSNSNDLLEAAITLYPAIKLLIQTLNQFGKNVYMSGSGSSCFMRFSTYQETKSIAQKIVNLDAKIYICRIMQRRLRKIGSSQAVRQRVLIPSCVGSNPTSPANYFIHFFCNNM